MISVFISHSSGDNSVTREICQRLGARGYESLFVYYRPEDDMVAGQQWWPQIMENVRQARVFMIVASASWKASDTCNQEMIIARAAGKPMVILRCDDVDLDPYLENIQAIDFRTPDDYSWRQLAEALAEAGADPYVFRPDPSRPPFPGLPAFEVEDSALYFGRETEIIDVLSRLEQRRLAVGSGQQP